MQVVVVGSGYVGLVSGACLAAIGHDVVCVETDRARIATLSGGDLPIYEPGLHRLVKEQRDVGRLRFVDALPVLDSSVDLVLVCVGTPARLDGGADLTALRTAIAQIAERVRGRLVVAIKSTVPVGTCDTIEAMFAEHGAGGDVSVVSNPEFLREGRAIADFIEPDRIVVGGDPQACAVLQSLYAPIVMEGHPLLVVSRRSAEMIKHASNGFLATRIAFINEVADLCESTGADVLEVAEGMGRDHRIGRDFLKAGPGYGGSCFPKDAEALLETADLNGVQMRVLASTVKANTLRQAGLANRVADALGGSVAGVRIGVLGLAFKGGTDDCRQSPALALIRDLIRQDADVVAYDPKAMGVVGERYPQLHLAPDPEACARGAHALVVATDCAVFRELRPEQIIGEMAGNVVVDLRNILDAHQWVRAGFAVYATGRPAMVPQAVLVEDAQSWEMTALPSFAS